MRHERTIDVLAGGMAHDLSNFVFTVRGHAELLLDSDSNSDVDAEGPEAILRATTRIQRVIDQLWSIARPETLRPEIVDPSELVAGAITLVAPVVSPDVEVSLDTVEGIVERVTADRSRSTADLIDLVLTAADAGATQVRFRIRIDDDRPCGPEVLVEHLHDADGGWTIESLRFPAVQAGTTAR